MGYPNDPVPLSPRDTLTEKILEHGRLRINAFERKIVGRKEKPFLADGGTPPIDEGGATKLRKRREALFDSNVVALVNGKTRVGGCTGRTALRSGSSMSCVTHAGESREMVGGRDKCSGKVPECCS